MSIREKLAMIEDMLEVDGGTITEGMILEELEEWDSMAYLSFSVLVQDEFGRKVTATEIKDYKTVRDLLDAMTE